MPITATTPEREAAIHTTRHQVTLHRRDGRDAAADSDVLPGSKYQGDPSKKTKDKGKGTDKYHVKHGGKQSDKYAEKPKPGYKESTKHKPGQQQKHGKPPEKKQPDRKGKSTVINDPMEEEPHDPFYAKTNEPQGEGGRCQYLPSSHLARPPDRL